MEFGCAGRFIQLLHVASGLSAAGGKGARLNLTRLQPVTFEGDMASYREMLLMYERALHIDVDSVPHFVRQKLPIGMFRHRTEQEANSDYYLLLLVFFKLFNL